MSAAAAVGAKCTASVRELVGTGGRVGISEPAQKLIIRIVGMVQQMWALENISFGRAY